MNRKPDYMGLFWMWSGVFIMLVGGFLNIELLVMGGFTVLFLGMINHYYYERLRDEINPIQSKRKKTKSTR